MDLTGNKACIISCGVGGWYGAGVRRLEKSLVYEGWGGSVLFWVDALPPKSYAHVDNPYSFKLFAFKYAFSLGYTHVLWCDSSLWAVANPMPIFDYVNDYGLWFFKSGYSISQTATDKLLEYHGLNRDDLMETPELATGCVGINIENPQGAEFFKKWEQSMELGMFSGNRVHDEQDSRHPAFLFSRQDQSAASMILHDMGIKGFSTPAWCAYKEKDMSRFPEAIFFIGGI